MSANGRLKTIRRHYDTLTPDERIKLLNAAELRDDETEVLELILTAPRIGFNVRHHYGIRLALTDLEIAIMLDFCHLSAELFRCMFLRMAMVGEVNDVPKGDMAALDVVLHRGQILDECILGFSRALLELRAAWQELAGEWGLDWQATVNELDVVRVALDMAEKQAGDQSLDPAETLEELRRFIDTRRAAWE